jgi:LPXTG-motif cell wall-anchored protein
MGGELLNKKRRIFSLFLTMLFMSSFILVPGVSENNAVKAEEIVRDITIDGRKVDPYNRFKGFGTVTCNNTSRLLLDYKEEHPDKYWEIMNSLFNKDTGAGLTHVKVELGADVNSSSGTEPATMRYPDEPANVLRGAGFHFAADAKSINPDITVEILRWGEPRWTWNTAGANNFEARYQWYKQTIDGFYKEYGFRIDYVGLSQNERAQNNNGKIETEWLKYFTSKIKTETNYIQDYEKIKYVAADGYRDTKSISSVLLNNADLIDEIDVISSHYGLSGSAELTQLQNKLISEGKKPKEVWISEGIAPMINARYRENMQPEYNGVGGTASIVDVASRVMLGYSWNGTTSNPLNAVSFDFQPAVASFYEGASYNPKHLISAFDPWSGFYEEDGGLQAVRQIMNFVGYDKHETEENERWMILPEATYNDGSFADGGVAVNSSTQNYMTMKDPKSDDYTTVFANNTSQTRKYKITASNLSGKENAPVYVWETRGADDGQAYDANWMQNIAKITPENGTYTVEVKPYSVLTITTLDKSGIEGFEYKSNPINAEKLKEDSILSLPYTDDFEYDEYAKDSKDRDYVERRGGTPRYTTDQNAAFEVVTKATKQAAAGSAKRENIAIPDADKHGNMLQQMIRHDNIGADWAVWGGKDGSAATSNPNTTLGDFRWVNYKASYDFLLDTNTPEVSGRSNYALIGVRQVKAGGNDSHAPYNARVHSNGKYEIIKLGSVVKQGTIEGFNNKEWHNLAFEAKENIFTLYLDNKVIDVFKDSDSAVMAGRITLGTGFYETLIDNLRVDPIEGYSYTSDKLDSAQGKVYASEEGALANNDLVNPIGYVGNWSFTQAGYAHFNRTQMSTTTNFPVWSGVSVGFRDSTTTQGTLNKVYYNGTWSENTTNKTGAEGSYLEIKFKGIDVNLYGKTSPTNGVGDVYLDGGLVGEANYLNNSEIDQIVWSVKNLEDKEHTLKVVAKKGSINFIKADISTTDPVLSTLNLAPTSIVKIADESQVGNLENTVYAIRKNGAVWGSQTSNAWANFNDSPVLVINFTGSGIDYKAATSTKSMYNFELDGQDVGNFAVNTSTGVMYSVRNLEQKPHTLKVSLKDNPKLDTYMDYRGATVYYTIDPNSVKTSSFIFDFDGSGFNLFGNTPDALLDVYVDDQLVDRSARVYSKGDRQTSYYIRGLSDGKHTAKVVVKGGSFTLDGIDIITGVETGKYDATLSEITLDGKPLEGFAKDKTEYNIALAPDTTTVPTVDVKTTQSDARAVITQPEALPGTAVITVTAPDVKTTKTYTIGLKSNMTPVLEAIGPKTVEEAKELTFTLAAQDKDVDNLTFSTAGLPEGATFDPVTKVFRWIPAYNKAGDYKVKFAVSDGELTDEEEITITVRPAPVTITITTKVNGEEKTESFTGTTADVATLISNADKKANITLDANGDKVIDKEIFDALKGTDKTITIEQNGVQWIFNGKDIINEAKSIDVTVNVAYPKNTTSSDKDKLTDMFKDDNVLVISFAENGTLPGKATVRVKLDEEWIEAHDKNNIYIYYFNPETNKGELIAKNLKVDSLGYVEFDITHNSDYIVADKDLITSPTTETVVTNTTTTEQVKATLGEIPQTGSMLDLKVLVVIGVSVLLSGFGVIGFRKKKVELSK